ncbi:hypothetical protein TNCV_2099941 [Trichonephila clavipes]|nr:hypothetical protein TNCV_2099941 [Trichonephila clavipes]
MSSSPSVIEDPPCRGADVPLSKLKVHPLDWCGSSVREVPAQVSSSPLVTKRASLPYTAGLLWYWARTRDKASHDPMPIPLGYRGHHSLLDVS